MAILNIENKNLDLIDLEKAIDEFVVKHTILYSFIFKEIMILRFK